MAEVDWTEVHASRKEIEELEARLDALYQRRMEIIFIMRGNGMKQREIGAYWGISNPRVSGILLNGRG